jgi:hypothetical protein
MLTWIGILAHCWLLFLLWLSTNVVSLSVGYFFFVVVGFNGCCPFLFFIFSDFIYLCCLHMYLAF